MARRRVGNDRAREAAVRERALRRLCSHTLRLTSAAPKDAVLRGERERVGRVETEVIDFEALLGGRLERRGGVE